MNPYWSRAPLDDHDADRTARPGLDGTEDAPTMRMRGRPGPVRTGGLAVQPAGPLAAGTGHRQRPECCPGPRMGHGAGQ
jgi:hypothetical protein